MQIFSFVIQALNDMSVIKLSILIILYNHKMYHWSKIHLALKYNQSEIEPI